MEISDFIVTWEFIHQIWVLTVLVQMMEKGIVLLLLNKHMYVKAANMDPLLSHKCSLMCELSLWFFFSPQVSDGPSARQGTTVLERAGIKAIVSGFPPWPSVGRQGWKQGGRKVPALTQPSLNGEARQMLGPFFPTSSRSLSARLPALP